MRSLVTTATATAAFSCVSVFVPPTTAIALDRPAPTRGRASDPPPPSVLRTTIAADDGADHRRRRRYSARSSSTSPPYDPRLVRRVRAAPDADRATELLYARWPVLRPDDDGGDDDPPSRSDDVAVDAAAAAAAVDALGRDGRWTEALDLARRCASTSSSSSSSSSLAATCYRAAVAACGANGAWETALELLREEIPGVLRRGEDIPVEIHHAVVAACGRNGRLGEAVRVLETLEKQGRADRTAYRAVLTAAGRCGSSVDEAAHASFVIRDVLARCAPTDRVAHTVAVAAAARIGDTNLAKELLEENEKQSENKIKEGDDEGRRRTNYHAVISACGKKGLWDEAAELTRRLKRVPVAAEVSDKMNGDDHRSASTNDDGDDNEFASYFAHLRDFPKVRDGKVSWWELGRWRAPPQTGEDDGDDNFPRVIRFGLRPHRNPAQNGLSLVFRDDQGRRVGFALLRHSRDEDDGRLVSALYGAYVEPRLRGQGLSAVLLATWLRIVTASTSSSSSSTNDDVVVPRTERIDKPLLASVLQRRLGFRPRDRTGVDVRVAPSLDGEANGRYALLTPTNKRAAGAFGERESRTQGAVPLTEREWRRRRRRCDKNDENDDESERLVVSDVFRVKTCLEHPAFARTKEDDGEDEEKKQRDSFEDIVRTALRTNGANPAEIEFLGDEDALRRALFGFVDSERTTPSSLSSLGTS